jgi:hypothetical protein
LSQELEYLPWSVAINRLGYIDNILDTTSAYGNFEKYVSNLILPIYNKLGWIEKTNETLLERFATK